MKNSFFHTTSVFAFLFVLLPAGKLKCAATESQSILWEDGVENAYPRWSNNGERILFQSNRTGYWQIYVMDRDGRNEQRITNDEFNDNFVDWSPDNSQIAFVSDRDGNEEIYVMKSDGSDVTRLTNDPAREIHPYWAPDGKTLLFNSDRDNASSFEVYRMQVSGGEAERLTNSDNVETCARYSPDQLRMVILYGGDNDDVVIADAHAQNMINITNSAAAEGWPSWAPSGKQIIYSCDEKGSFALYLISVDGSNRQQLTFPPIAMRDARAQISPDGKTIVFNRQIEGTIGIFTLPLGKTTE